MHLKILHISNHVGTIANANSVVQHLEKHYPDVRIELNHLKWPFSYYITEQQADEIFAHFRNHITQFNVLLFTDTPMCARPFLQNIDNHNCYVIQYVVNRIDWGLWSSPDDIYLDMFKNLSQQHPRVRFISDNRYDQFYAEQTTSIKFIFKDCVRLCPVLAEQVILPSKSQKLFIQNRGNHIGNYQHILDNLNIEYDVFGEGFAPYKDKEQICEYLGILHLPYQVNIQSLWENLGYYIVYFIPSAKFLKELITMCNWYYWEEKTRDPTLLQKSIELSEWYSPDLSQCFEYFDSWDELAVKYEVFKKNNVIQTLQMLPAWYLERRVAINKTAHKNVSDNIRKWHLLLNNVVNQQPLIVTMFYNVRKKDNDISDFHRKQEKFYELAANFILKVKAPLFICMDEDDEDLYTFVMEQRYKNGLAEITYCYRENFEKSYFYKYVPRIRELQGQYTIYNGNPRHETPLYITLNNNKFYYMERAIEINPTNANKFMWLDMGINHVAKEPFLLEEWLSSIPVDKIKQMCINPYLERDEPRDLFHNIFHHTAGGLFAGGVEPMRRYIELYKAKVEQIYNMENWYQIDEAIMTMIQRENRDLFEFYYGDYEGIIANFNSRPRYSIDLILKGASKCLTFNNTSECFKIMKYLEPYFMEELNQKCEMFYKFIIFNIICNYYQNGGKLLESVIELINKHIESGDNMMKNVISSNMNNLGFYSNRCKIIGIS